MRSLEDMLQAARTRTSALPSLEPSGRAGGDELLAILQGRDRPAIIGQYRRQHPRASDEDRPLPIRPALRGFLAAGVDALSVITEHSRYEGQLLDLELAARTGDVPVIMTDMIMDAAWVRTAAALGAHGVEVIARILSKAALDEIVAACDETGCLPVIQCWTRAEVEAALRHPRTVVRLTDTDLETLERDASRIRPLLETVPTDRVVIAPGDLERPSHSANLRGRVDALVLGTGLLRARDPKALIQEITN